MTSYSFKNSKYSPSIAVLIPCYNEAATIESVIKDFRHYLPEAAIYVYDNNSDDATAKIAEEAGATVVFAPERGKGNVVRRMFADTNADICVVVDGDSTYSASDAPKMVKCIKDGRADMVIAARKEISEQAYRDGHKFGNNLFNFILKILFGSNFSDIFSGYRAFSRRFIKTFPVMSNGFDIEAELSIHALTLSIPCLEIESEYRERPPNSHSKLSTFKDGAKILLSIIKLVEENRPILFFGTIALLLFLMSLCMAYPIVDTFVKTGLVPRLPTAVLSMGTMLAALLSVMCGLILDSVSQGRIENKKLHYLRFLKTNGNTDKE